MTHIEIREIVLPADKVAIEELDKSFTTDVIFDAELKSHTIQLVVRQVTPPVTKHFEFDEPNLGQGNQWTKGWVAVGIDRIRGFIAVEFESWNKRLKIWHFYVDSSCRRQGVGRQLLERAIAHGCEVGAKVAWIETTNLNYPGMQTYERLGFKLCGLDLSLYKGTSFTNEFALFLARDIE